MCKGIVGRINNYTTIFGEGISDKNICYLKKSMKRNILFYKFSTAKDIKNNFYYHRRRISLLKYENING